MVIFPIYSKIQQKKEEILKLFGTLPKDKLDNKMNSLEKSSVMRIFSQYTKVNQEKKRLTSVKKRNISQTNNLDKFNISIFLGALTVFVLVSF